MPYIKQRQRSVLEKEVDVLAEKIKKAGALCDKASPQCLQTYGYVCWELALQVMPEKRYATLSATRATFLDAADEWCRRMKVKKGKLHFPADSHLILLQKEIAELAALIKKISTEAESYNTAYPGLLNYCYTAIGLKIMGDKNDKFLAKQIANALRYLGFSFYKNCMAPYEDEQIAKNGDVF